MDIHAATHYMKEGYKVRRPTWDQGEYIYNCVGVIERCTVEGTSQSLGDWVVYLSDLIATDWEILIEDEHVV